MPPVAGYEALHTELNKSAILHVGNNRHVYMPCYNHTRLKIPPTAVHKTLDTEIKATIVVYF